MGAVMSARLVAAGFTVHGFDTSPAARAALADAPGDDHAKTDRPDLAS